MAVAIRRSSVDLPAPFGPRTRTDSPRSTRRSTRTRAGVTPNTRVTPERTTAGDPVRSSCSGRRESTLLDVPGEATRPQRYRRPRAGGPGTVCRWVLLRSPHLSRGSKGGEVEVVQTLVNALVIGAAGVILARMTHNLRQEVKSEISELRVEVRHEIARVDGSIADLRTGFEGSIADFRTGVDRTIAELRTGVEGGIAELRADMRDMRLDMREMRAEIREIRSDLTQVALAVGVQRRAGHQ